ncbi:MAG: TldD/PmbA family protein, partial [Bacteroidales bacterium]|nr:TldD/PmbA family protein [Bacteroidales bacterium]
QIALEKAQAKKGAVQVKSGRYRMLVENEVASKLVSPLLNALNAWSLQQNNSFLRDTLGKKCFSEKFQLRDIPRTPGLQGVRWYDSEGVATRNADIIRDGVVQQYFVSSYMARKTGLEPNIEMPNKVFLPPTIPGSSLDDLVSACPEGILITDFNGGNFNSSTGDFSYGIEGFLIRGGKLAKPIEGMVVTGNLVELWNHFEAAADDTRNCMSKLIPTLAFSYADFSGE